MTAEQFFSKVAAMRRAQIEYLHSHDTIALRRCRALEKKIDEEIARVSRLNAEQKRVSLPSLF